jgi:leucyl-tRNA---protein transferase
MDNRLYLLSTPLHPCSYLPHRQATKIFIDTSHLKTMDVYNTLSKHGFRRSGNELYRPHCADCEECLPVRVPVQHFTPRRSQRRTWQRNQDLTVTAKPSDFQLEHFQLYCRYLASRHPGSDMENPTKNDYIDFFNSQWATTRFYEFRLARQLMAVAVVDHLKDGLSAVYTFFDPRWSARSLGVYAVLWEIEEAKRLNKEWLYLGYWVSGCRKMSYKMEYQPLEVFYNGKWRMENGK